MSLDCAVPGPGREKALCVGVAIVSLAKFVNVRRFCTRSWTGMGRVLKDTNLAGHINKNANANKKLPHTLDVSR
jgi:hypothetical protein